MGGKLTCVLNVSVGGISLYASVTTCIPASGKELNLKVDPLLKPINTTCSSSPRIFHSSPCKNPSTHLTFPETRESHLSVSLCGVL